MIKITCLNPETLLDVLEKYSEVGILMYFNEYMKGERRFIIN
jgi:hypothetical protein